MRLRRKLRSHRPLMERPVAGTDLIAFFLRTIIVIILAITPAFNLTSEQSPTVMRIALAVAIVYVMTVGMSWIFFRRFVHGWPRLLGIVIDLTLITALLFTLGGIYHNRNDELLMQYYRMFYQLYYLVIMVAALWYGLSGALLTALASSGLWWYTLATVDPMASWPPWQSGDLLWATSGLFLILVAFVAGLLAQAMHRESVRAARLDQQALIARTLQDAMLPFFLPDLPGFEVGRWMQAAHRIGGDFWDIMDLGDGRYMLGIGDMAGKSIHGLVLLLLVQRHLRGAAREAMTPAEIATYINRHAYESLQPESYASIFIGILETPSGRFTFANCGHPPPLLLRGKSGTMEELQTGDPVIGAQPKMQYRQSQVELRPEDMLLMYTDGVVEARNRKGESFGIERVIELLREGQMDAQQIAEHLVALSARYSGRLADDDATVVLLRRLRPGETTSTTAAARHPGRFWRRR